METQSVNSSDSTNLQDILKIDIIEDSSQEKYVAPLSASPYENLTQEELKAKLLKYHNEKLEKFEDFSISQDQVCVDKVINFSGEPLMLPNFHDKDRDPDTENVFKIEPEERLNFLNLFEPKQINRNRKNIKMLLVEPGMHGFPKLLMVEDLKVKVPWNLTKIVPITRLREKGVKMAELPVNRYDLAFVDTIKKEKEYNEKIMQRAGMGDITKRPTQEQFDKTLE